MRQKVEDIAKWRGAYNSIVDLRREAGERSLRLFQVGDDPQDLLQLDEWESEEHLQRFMQRMTTPEMREKLSDVGVLGPPEVLRLTAV